MPGVEKGIESVLSCGPLAGFPVFGLKASLIDGSYHNVDSSVLAFEIAGRMCCREGLRLGKSRLMEPIMKVDVTVPENHVGDVIGDLNSRRGVILEMGDVGSLKTVSALVPLGCMFQYVSRLRGMTKGRGNYYMKFHKYDFTPAHIEEELVAKFKPKTGDD